MARSYSAGEGRTSGSAMESAVKNFKSVLDSGVNSSGKKQSVGRALYEVSKSLEKVKEGGVLGDGMVGNGKKNASGGVDFGVGDLAFFVNDAAEQAGDVMADGLGEEGEHETIISLVARDGTKLGEVSVSYSVETEEGVDEREVGWSYRDESPQTESVDVTRKVVSEASVDRGGLKELLRSRGVTLGEKEFNAFADGIDYSLKNFAPEGEWEDSE